jgi:hypothetical protein
MMSQSGKEGAVGRGHIGRQLRHPVLSGRQDAKHEWQNYAGKTMAIKILYNFDLFSSHASIMDD